MHDTEDLYGIACEGPYGANLSACRDLESFIGRKPFMLKSGKYYEQPTKARSRAYVGKKFAWNGEYVTVTSFATDQLSFTACSYRTMAEKEHRRDAEAAVEGMRSLDTDKQAGWTRGVHREEIKRRYRITHADLTVNGMPPLETGVEPDEHDDVPELA